MNESFSSNLPEPKKVGVWTEGAHIEPKEFIIPKNSPESSDDIPTIPDLDDLQDILEKEIAKPPPTDRKDSETVNTLAAVGDGYSGAADGVEAALAALKARVPVVRPAPDTVWTVDLLLAQLAEEGTDLESADGLDVSQHPCRSRDTTGRNIFLLRRFYELPAVGLY